MIFKGIISLCGHCKRQCITHLLPPLPSTKGNKEVAELNTAQRAVGQPSKRKSDVHFLLERQNSLQLHLMLMFAMITVPIGLNFPLKKKNEMLIL